MTRDPYWHDEFLTLWAGDCLEVLGELPERSVQTVVTSPPYWGLRDYGTAQWEGGLESCTHQPELSTPEQMVSRSTLHGGIVNIITAQELGERAFRGSCPLCGAKRVDVQLGLEETPEAFLANMVDVFRGVRRVLRDDGTVWLNIGDTYAGSGPIGTFGGHGGTSMLNGADLADAQHRGGRVAGLKAKDLCGIPWRLAFALQADGWYLRSDIIWSKPNPMPESVSDRPTKSHEYMFLLAKQERYYFDAEAVRLPPTQADDGREARIKVPPHGQHVMAEGHRGQVERTYAMVKGANIRTVWTIPTEPYPGAHFATFPRALVVPCVKAGTPEWGSCAECGTPWKREVEVGYVGDGSNASDLRKAQGELGPAYMEKWMRRVSRTLGWKPGCAHGGRPVPAVVLDPFAGSGTTLLVAQQLSRRGWGIDASPDYLTQALARNAQLPLGLA